MSKSILWCCQQVPERVRPQGSVGPREASSRSDKVHDREVVCQKVGDASVVKIIEETIDKMGSCYDRRGKAYCGGYGISLEDCIWEQSSSFLIGFESSSRRIRSVCSDCDT